MARERIKPIILTDTETGKEYTLEFNRASVMYAESKGFNHKEFETKPMTMMVLLWTSAFRMHHPEVSAAQASKLLDGIGTVSEELIKRLYELYILGGEALNDANPKVTVIL